MKNLKLIINEVSNIDKKILDSFELQDELYPGVWENNKIKPEIRKRLILIAQDFINSLELESDPKIKDIVLTGSSANYNWSEYSDIDLHIRIPFDTIAMDEGLVKKMFDGKRGLWNDAHDIKIKDLPVEIYVENVGDPHVASGLYSLAKNKWLSEPPKGKVVIDKDDIKSKAQSYLGIVNYLDDLMKNEEYEKVIIAVDKIKEKLKRMRSSGLAKGGEFSVENLAFKVLRRSGYIGEVLEMKQEAYDRFRSIE